MYKAALYSLKKLLIKPLDVHHSQSSVRSNNQQSKYIEAQIAGTNHQGKTNLETSIGVQMSSDKSLAAAPSSTIR
jgi:hypothetical protein